MFQLRSTPIPPKSPKSYKAKTLGTSLNNSLTVPHIPSLYSTPLLYPFFLISTILVPKPGTSRRTTGPLSVPFSTEQQQSVSTSQRTTAEGHHLSKEQQHGVNISAKNSSTVSASRQRKQQHGVSISAKNSSTVSESQQRTAARCQHRSKEQQHGVSISTKNSRVLAVCNLANNMNSSRVFVFWQRAER